METITTIGIGIGILISHFIIGGLGGVLCYKEFLIDTPSRKLTCWGRFKRMTLFPMDYHGWSERGGSVSFSASFGTTHEERMKNLRDIEKIRNYVLISVGFGFLKLIPFLIGFVQFLFIELIQKPFVYRVNNIANDSLPKVPQIETSQAIQELDTFCTDNLIPPANNSDYRKPVSISETFMFKEQSKPS